MKYIISPIKIIITLLFLLLSNIFIISQTITSPKWSISSGEADEGDTGCFPDVADDGTIYVTGGFNGGILALPGSSPLADTDWPKGLQNNFNNSRFNGVSSNTK